MTTATGSVAAARVSESTRWLNLIFCIICMIMIANLQYGWTLFVNPINKAHGWSIASIQVAFAVFIALETWLTPIEGWIADVIGPKIVIAFGGIMVGIGWVINSYANSLELLYLGAVIGGTGGGAVYATSVGQAVKWFPDRRGLAVGLTAAGYGAGAVLTVIPIRYVIGTYGYEAAFLWFGIVQGAVVFVLAWFIRAPLPGELAFAPAAKVAMTKRSFSPKEVLVSPVFWLLYIMFVMVSASGLMATAQIAPIAKDFNVGNVILFGTASTLTVALIVDGICNGGARPLFGWVSDNIGREYTMAIAFGLGCSCLLVAGNARRHALVFRGVRRADLPDLGRDLQPVSLHLYRYFWSEIRDGQSQPALYGEGHLGIPRADRQCDEDTLRQLARGIRGHRSDEHRRGGFGAIRAQADARPPDGEELIDAIPVRGPKPRAGFIGLNCGCVCPLVWHIVYQS